MNLSKEPDDRRDAEFFENQIDEMCRHLGMSEAEIQRQKHKARKQARLRKKRREKRYRK